MDGRDLNLGPQACVGGTSLTEACPQPLDLKHVDSKSYCVLPVLLEAECSSWSFYLEVITKLLMSLLGTETSALDALKSPNAQFQLRSSNTTHCKHPPHPMYLVLNEADGSALWMSVSPLFHFSLPFQVLTVTLIVPLPGPFFLYDIPLLLLIFSFKNPQITLETRCPGLRDGCR